MMERNTKPGAIAVLNLFLLATLLLFVSGSNARAQKSRAAVAPLPAAQAPLFNEYKGVRLGMTGEQARSKLGKSTFSDKELDYFVLSNTEAVQVGYDAQGKVNAISIDFQNGIGAPDPKAVVGADLELRENGTSYRVVHYDSLGFWVSYSRTAGPVLIVTITMQKM